MGEQLTNLSFEEWLDYIFNRPVTDPIWHGDDDYDWDFIENSSITVSYITQAFENSITTISHYSDAQLDQGLQYILHVPALGYHIARKDSRVPLAERQRLIQSMHTIFEQLFLPRCSQFLATFDDPDKRKWNPLNRACYMWWDDLRPFSNSIQVDLKIFDEEFEVMTRILDLDSEACRESALHGLGHWHRTDPQRIASTIDNFLAKYPMIRPELAKYALRAREGHVL